jgi:Na+/proline symporter
MTFTFLDWLAIVGYLLITLLLGLYFRRSSGKSELSRAKTNQTSVTAVTELA